jgi:hypothetical protein
MNSTEIETRRQALALLDQAESILRGCIAENRAPTRGEDHKVNELNRQSQELLDSVAGGEALRRGQLEAAAERLGMTVDGDVRTSEPGQHPMPNVIPRAVHEQLYDAYRSGRVEPIPLVGLHDSLRTITAASQSTISDFRPQLTYDLRYDMFRVANLMRMDATTQASVTYYRETTGSVAAATVAEGAAKPESTAVWSPVVATVKKIAHYSDVSKEALEDFVGFQQIVTRSLLMGLANAENTQVLNGDGTGTNLLGLLNQSGILTYAPGAPEARILSVRKALTILQQGSSYDMTADAILMNPSDWEKLQLSTASGSGEFLDEGAAVVTGGQPSIWGVPVKTTNRIAAGTSLLGNFADAGTIYYREAPVLFMDPYSQSRNNLTRMICEERLTSPALGRPTALVKITYNGAA